MEDISVSVVNNMLIKNFFTPVFEETNNKYRFINIYESYLE